MGGTDQKTVRKQKLKSDTDIFEIIIFTLSPVLGGRDQVLATPFIECVKYVELENTRKKNERYNRFMDAVYSDMSNGVNKQKRQKYIETLQPEQTRKPLKMETDLDMLKKAKEEQEKKRAKQSEQGG